MKAAFRTADGLIAIANCPDVDESAMVIMRWVQPNTARVRVGRFLEPTLTNARRYNRTPETFERLPLFVEEI